MPSSNNEDYYSSPKVLLVQLVSYISALVFSLVVCVPMSIHQEHFKGHCLLFSTGEWQERDGQFKVDWASQAYCNFTIFVAVVTFLLSLGFGIRVVSYMKNKRDASFFAAFCEVLAVSVLCLMSLIACIFVTGGFKTWCDEMTQRFEQCSDAAGNPIDKADGIDSSQFYFHMTAANFGQWGCMLSAFTALMAAMVKLCRYHHQENLRVSMAKERKRLINEDIVSEVPTTRGPSEGGRRRRAAAAAAAEQDGPFEEVRGIEEGPDPSATKALTPEDGNAGAAATTVIRGNQIRVEHPENYFDYR